MAATSNVDAEGKHRKSRISERRSSGPPGLVSRPCRRLIIDSRNASANLTSLHLRRFRVRVAYVFLFFFLLVDLLLRNEFVLWPAIALLLSS